MAKNFSRDVADKLLDKLSKDDDFRDLFQTDPRAALAQLGHVTPEADMGKEGIDPVVCLSGASLASKEDIQKSRSTLHDRLSTSAFHYEPLA